jgi:hypothetical protein
MMALMEEQGARDPSEVDFESIRDLVFKAIDK